MKKLWQTMPIPCKNRMDIVHYVLEFQNKNIAND